MDSIDRLTELFEKFPGIGPRQARRFVQYLLSTSSATRQDLADLVRRLGAETTQCRRCFRWFAKAKPVQGVDGLCSICADSHRDATLLFVVEKDADIENVERSGFRGLYFVLGGTIPLASDTPEKYIRLRELVKRVETDAVAGSGIREIIFGLSATTEGDHTRLILQEHLTPLAGDLNFKLSSLGRGLSTGSELEYADPDTIAEALGNRH